MILKKYFIKSGLSILLTVGLFGCAAGTFVKPDGTTEQPIWPKVNKASIQKKGTFPNMANLQQVRAGMTKDQMYVLLGVPHFSELWGVREWNFLFHFHTPNMGENGVSSCQYKILYDEHGIARNFYWQAVTPEDGDCPPKIKKSQTHTMSADALFDFNSSTLADLNSSGKSQLDRLAEKLADKSDIQTVHVHGFTDYLGNAEYNQQLSERRAQAVRHYLIKKGISSALIQAKGMGEQSPVKTCSKSLKRATLIACLQPNRRVEVIVDTEELPNQ